ncbi:hypothetical protein AC480_04715 [miscellaneous Crenarchaeota group archaeon SMTZ1-55]|nr:MAG: hypothetical protein AC480_04715 [miscellaneous Crenarchaeota group archaeon SMTZ1-55]
MNPLDGAIVVGVIQVHRHAQQHTHAEAPHPPLLARIPLPLGTTIRDLVEGLPMMGRQVFRDVRQPATNPLRIVNQHPQDVKQGGIPGCRWL